MTNNNKLEQKADIVGALARGYCSKENEHKVLDPELIEAMVPEIETLIEQTRKERDKEIVKMIKKNSNYKYTEDGYRLGEVIIEYLTGKNI